MRFSGEVWVIAGHFVYFHALGDNSVPFYRMLAVTLFRLYVDHPPVIGPGYIVSSGMVIIDVQDVGATEGARYGIAHCEICLADDFPETLVEPRHFVLDFPLYSRDHVIQLLSGS